MRQSCGKDHTYGPSLRLITRDAAHSRVPSPLPAAVLARKPAPVLLVAGLAQERQDRGAQARGIGIACLDADLGSSVAGPR